jgi:tetratricopeptide (TPR) repeat protein
MLGYSSDPAADLAIADNAANHALLIQPNRYNSLRAKAFVLRAQGKWQEAEAVLRRVIGLQPTEANRHYELGQVLMAEGRHQEALESFEAAKRFAGGGDGVFDYDAGIAMAELAMGQLAEATAMARLSLSEYPPDSGRAGEIPWLALIAAEGASGKDEQRERTCSVSLPHREAGIAWPRLRRMRRRVQRKRPPSSSMASGRTDGASWLARTRIA